MLRALVLSLLILCTVAATLPLADSLAKGPKSAAASHHRRHRRHSRAWWRKHRRLLRRRRAAAAARHARLQSPTTQDRPATVAPANPAATAAEAHALLTPALPTLALPNLSAQPALANLPMLAVKDVAAPAPPALPAPAPPRKAVAPAWPSAWHNLPVNASGELRFSVRSADGRNTGAVAWARVAAPQVAASASAQARAKTLGEAETAEALGMSERSVQREWAAAREWLRRGCGI